MSDALYTTRLRWQAASGRGCALCDGVRIELRERPRVLIDVQHLVDIEYTPAIGVAYLQDATGSRRDLHGFECDAINDWLMGVAARARACL